MARVSIYVPDSMKARMDPLGDRVNWSNVAQQAFDIELSKTTQIGDDEMQNAIERLRASKAEFVRGEKELGIKDGRHWALNEAAFPDLRRMAKIAAGDEQEEFAAYVNRAFGVETMDEDAWFFDADTREFESDEYVVGFLQSVEEVWDEVSDKL